MAAMPMKFPPVARPAAFIAGALACAIAAVGCTSGSAAPGGSASPSAASPAAATGQAGELHWHTCPIPPAQMRCASLQVPLDYRHPAGRKITLAVSEMPATAPAAQRQGYLLVNPGGPGASGLSLAADVAAGLNPTVASEYNIIGFDPRGVGSSVPALHCDPSFFAGVRPDYIPANAQAEQVLLGRAKSYAAGCQRRYGWLLPFMTTADTARDMDSIRAALGAQKITYFGYSWGTYLGQVYATLFPHRLRRMALDSVVNPRGVWYADNIDQDYAFEGRIRAFFSWIAAHDAVYHLGSTQAQVQQAWSRARARLEAHPIAGPTGPMIGPDEFDDTFLVGGYTNTVWPGLAVALAAYLRQHDNAPMVEACQGAGGAEREREPVRGLQRGAVQRRQLAAELGEMGRRHQAGLPDGAVRGLGQRLVQRRLRLLAGAGPGPSAADPRRRGCPAS